MRSRRSRSRFSRVTSLDWPFYEPRHRELAATLGAWASANLGPNHGDDVDGECRTLVRELGAAGFLDLCVSTDSIPDVRSLAIARETLAHAAYSLLGERASKVLGKGH